MSKAVIPSTPKAQAAQAAVSTPSPGTWRHPKFDEITRRQNASVFDESNVRRIMWNGGALFSLWIVNNFIGQDFQKALLPEQARPYPQLLLFLLYLILIYNIGTALLPLVRKPDALADIPLTPTQRSLLGLDPDVPPSSSPSAQYITPPRYPRSPTPRTSSPGSRSGSASDSPLSRKGSPLARPGSGGAYSPSASPMWQKAVETTRRNSYGTPSPLGRALGGSVLGAPSTPSPASGKGASVGLNSKWLYERGRASPRGAGVYS